jgi:cytoskeleton protein RodZ
MSELSEDIEVVSPGQLLKEGREKLGWSQQEVAQRLNLRSTVVHNLEQDRFDDKVSATFVRGYLRAYARLLGISEDLIINSYDHLGIAQVQYAEMQSFSRRTRQEAHDNRLMMVTYAIVLALIALTVLWWVQQENSGDAEFQEQFSQAEMTTEVSGPETPEVEKPAPVVVAKQAAEPVQVSVQPKPEPKPAQPVQAVQPSQAPEAVTVEDQNLAEVVMLFTADCWVRVEDGTGERLAIGIKRAGKRMVLNGQPPFKVILGAPEAVTIQYQGQPFDMSFAKPGRTARFSIPVQE